MINEYQTYNKKGEFLAAYGLGWNLADIMRNQYHLVDKDVYRVDVVINSKIVSSVTRQELRDALA